MLTFILFTFLRMLPGTSFSDTLGLVVPAEMSTLMGRESSTSPNDTGQQFRTVYSIVQSCLLTIFACVWTSAHPNINGPRDSGWTCTKRRMILMLCTVVAPEVVLLWACRQYSGAKWIARKYNKEFARSGETERPFWRKAVGWFRPLPKATTRRGYGQSWTITHGFFIQMGGFVLYEDEYPKEVLDYDRLAQLLRDKAIDTPTMTERDLQDRSKGDTISKVIIVQQTTWFVVQCIARILHRLPLSELEVLTLAFAVMNAAIYCAWWNKPQGVELSIPIPLKRVKKEIGTSTVPSTSEEEPCKPKSLSYSESASLPQFNYRHSNDTAPLITPPAPDSDEVAEEMHTWFWRTAQKDYRNYTLLYFLFVRLPYRISMLVLRPLGKMVNPYNFRSNTPLRMAMFYSTDGPEQDNNIDTLELFASLVVGSIFGAIHLISWSSEFPSARDHLLWRISAIVVAVNPLLLLLAALEIEAIRPGLSMSTVFMVPFYIAARFVLIIIALKAILHPNPRVLFDISWTSYIPHF